MEALPFEALQASQTPFSSKLIVLLALLMLCLNSTALLGLWLEITQELQYSTLEGSPYFVGIVPRLLLAEYRE